VPEIHHARYGDLDGVRMLLRTVCPPDELAAIFVEPIQGEGGYIVPPPDFLPGLRALCDQHGMLLILDEVQCGYGRTGKFFAHEWAGIEPDIMAVAKGIGGGFPLGACLAKGEVAKSMVPGTHGSTYGGNPLACTIGNAVLDRIMEPGFIEHVNQMGQRLQWHLQQLQQRYPNFVLELRGKGLLAGIKLPDKLVVREFVARLRDDHQLLTQGAGENVLRLLPPLVITEDQVREAIGLLSAAARDFETQKTTVAA